MHAGRSASGAKGFVQEDDPAASATCQGVTAPCNAAHPPPKKPASAHCQTPKQRTDRVIIGVGRAAIQGDRAQVLGPKHEWSDQSGCLRSPHGGAGVNCSTGRSVARCGHLEPTRASPGRQRAEARHAAGGASVALQNQSGASAWRELCLTTLSHPRQRPTAILGRNVEDMHGLIFFRRPLVRLVLFLAPV